MADNGVPRLGREGTSARPKLRREVMLEDAEATILLTKPKVGQVIDFEASASETNRESYNKLIDVLVGMVLEPKLGDGPDDDLTEDEFRAEMEALSVQDWSAVQDVVVELSGISKEALEAAKAQFQKAQPEAVPVPARARHGGGGPVPSTR